MRFVYVCGEPSTGKSTLVRSILEKSGEPTHNKTGLCMWSEYADVNLVALGNYTDLSNPFCGTDRLSFTAINDAEKLLERFSKNGTSVISEGDRLANERFFTSAKDLGFKTHIVVVKSDENIQKERHMERKDLRWNRAPDDRWFRGRKTKYSNIEKNHATTVLVNNTPQDLDTNKKVLQSLVFGKIMETSEW